MTTAAFKYIDRASYDPNATEPFKKPWGKVVEEFCFPIRELVGLLDSVRVGREECISTRKDIMLFVWKYIPLARPAQSPIAQLIPLSENKIPQHHKPVRVGREECISTRKDIM
jgi:hypothetical protein